MMYMQKTVKITQMMIKIYKDEKYDAVDDDCGNEIDDGTDIVVQNAF